MGSRFGSAICAIIIATSLFSIWWLWEPAFVQAQGGGGSGPGGHTYLIFETSVSDCALANPADAVPSPAAYYENGPLNTFAKLWLCVYDTTTFNFRGSSETEGASSVSGGVELYNKSTGELLDDWSSAHQYDFCGQCPYNIFEAGECIEMSCCGDKTITLEPGSYRFQADASAGTDVFGSCDENYSASFVQIVAPEEPDDDDPITYTCESLGGIELVSETVRMDALDRWRGWITDTGWSRLYALITLDQPDYDTAAYAVGDVNGESRSLHLSSGPDMEPQSFAVPDARGGVAGPEADVEVTAQSSGLDLLSVCILPTDFDYCPNGVEALTTRPLDMDALSGHWEGGVEISATHIVVKYVLAARETDYSSRWWEYYDGTITQQACVNRRCILADYEPDYIGEVFTYTHPPDASEHDYFEGVIELSEPYVDLELDNRGNAARMYSICVMDANDVFTDGIPGLSPQECHLLNPDFTQDISFADWQPRPEDAGALTHITSDQEAVDGALRMINGYGVGQNPYQHDRGDTYDLEVRARSGGSVGRLTFGTPYATEFAGGSQRYSVTMPSYYQIYRETVHILSDGEVEVYGDTAVIDYVCLRDPENLLNAPENCDLPSWNPPAFSWSLDYLVEMAKYLGQLFWQMLQWVVCRIHQLLAWAINPIYNVIRDLVIEWPVFPDPNDGMVSWMEWLAEAAYVILDWLGINGKIFGEWFPYAGESIAEWLLRLFTEILYWLFDQLGWGTGVLNDMDLILDELLLFVDAILEELNYETGQLMALLRDTGNVLLIPVTGFRQALTGSTTADIGIGAGGYAGYIWQGMQYMNERIQNTPLPALNVLALGVITLGLVQWTLKRYLSVLS